MIPIAVGVHEVHRRVAFNIPQNRQSHIAPGEQGVGAHALKELFHFQIGLGHFLKQEFDGGFGVFGILGRREALGVIIKLEMGDIALAAPGLVYFLQFVPIVLGIILLAESR